MVRKIKGALEKPANLARITRFLPARRQMCQRQSQKKNQIQDSSNAEICSPDRRKNTLWCKNEEATLPLIQNHDFSVSH